MQLYSAELTATPIFQSFPLRSLLRVEVATQVVLVPSTYQNGMWLRAGRTHWLLTQQGADVSVSSELGGVPMVGHLDATSSEEGEALDVRLRGVAADTLTITHHRNGERKVGGVYTMRADRGNPVLVSSSVCASSCLEWVGLCRHLFNCIPGLTNQWPHRLPW